MTAEQLGSRPAGERAVSDLVFVALNNKVIALDRYEGQVVWEWKSSKSARFLSLLLDGDRLIVGANGYIFCLDPLYGQVVWSNELKGYGVGITSLASVAGQTGGAAAAVIQAQLAAAAAAAGGAGAAGAG